MRNKLIFLVVLLAGIVFADAGLVSEWHMDENTGGTSTDSSGNGNTLTVSASAWNATGKFGSTILNYGTVSGSSTLNLTTSEMTIEAWVYHFSNSANQAYADVNREDSYAIRTDGSNRPYFQVNTTTGTYSVASSSTMTLNQWHHVLGVYNSTNASLYIDGMLNVSSSASGNITKPSSNAFYIGNNGWGNGLDGDVDEVRIYNRALSPEEIKAHANCNYDKDSGNWNIFSANVFCRSKLNITGALNISSFTNFTNEWYMTVNYINISSGSTFVLNASGSVPGSISFNDTAGCGFAGGTGNNLIVTGTPTMFVTINSTAVGNPVNCWWKNWQGGNVTYQFAAFKQHIGGWGNWYINKLNWSNVIINAPLASYLSFSTTIGSEIRNTTFNWTGTADGGSGMILFVSQNGANILLDRINVTPGITATNYGQFSRWGGANTAPIVITNSHISPFVYINYNDGPIFETNASFEFINTTFHSDAYFIPGFSYIIAKNFNNTPGDYRIWGGNSTQQVNYSQIINKFNLSDNVTLISGTLRLDANASFGNLTIKNPARINVSGGNFPSVVYLNQLGNLSVDAGSGFYAYNSSLTIANMSPMGWVYSKVDATNKSITRAFGNLSYKDVLFAQGTVGLWHFDEGSGSTAVNEINRDARAVSGTASWNSSGKYGAAFQFTGATSIDSGINFSSAGLNNEHTAEAWVYFTNDIAQWETIFGAWPAGGQNIHLGKRNNKVFSAHVFVGSQFDAIGTTTIQPYTWYHVAETFKLGGNLTLYVNGVQEAITAVPSGAMQGSSCNITIGQRCDNANFVNGIIDMVRISNRALKPEEFLPHEHNNIVLTGTNTQIWLPINTTVYADNSSLNVTSNLTIQGTLVVINSTLNISEGTRVNSTGKFNMSQTNVSSVGFLQILSGGIVDAPTGVLTINNVFLISGGSSTIENSGTFNHNFGTVKVDPRTSGLRCILFGTTSGKIPWNLEVYGTDVQMCYVTGLKVDNNLNVTGNFTNAPSQGNPLTVGNNTYVSGILWLAGGTHTFNKSVTIYSGGVFNTTGMVYVNDTEFNLHGNANISVSGNLILTNVTMTNRTPNVMNNGNLTIRWKNIKVVDENGNAISAATANVTQGSVLANAATGSDGILQAIVTDYENIGGTTTLRNANISAFKAGYLYNSILDNMTASEYTLVIAPSGGAASGFNVGTAVYGTPNSTTVSPVVKVSGLTAKGPWQGIRNVTIEDGSGNVLVNLTHNFSMSALPTKYFKVNTGSGWAGIYTKDMTDIARINDTLTLNVPVKDAICNTQACIGPSKLYDTNCLSTDWSTVSSTRSGNFCLATVSGTVVRDQADLTSIVSVPELDFIWVLIIFTISYILFTRLDYE